MNNLDIDRMRWLLEKYCINNECALYCKPRQRLLKRNCEIAKFIEYISNNNMDGPIWYYCKRHNHYWTDRPDLDNGQPTGFNKGEKDCGK